MGLNDIIKKLIVTILLLIGLVVGYIYSKPYLPTITSKYQAITQSVHQIINGQDSVSESEQTTIETHSSTETPTSSLQTTISQETSQETTMDNIDSEQTSSELTSHESERDESTNNLHPNDFITLIFSGYDRDGMVKHSFDKGQLLDTMDMNSEDIDKFLESIVIEIEPNKYLTNGDKIKLFVSVPDEFQEIMPDYVLSKNVQGLKERKVFSQNLIQEAIDVDFEGYNGNGHVNYTVDFGNQYDNLAVKEPKQKDHLSNGDEIIFELTDQSKEILQKNDYTLENNGKFIMKVKGLKETETVSQETINKHVVVNFVGTSGVGNARIDATFQPPLSEYLNKDSFEVANNGHIKNDEVVKISIKQEILDDMLEDGFIVENQGMIQRTAKNMLQVSDDFKGIKNHKQLQEKVDKQMKQQFPDTLFGSYDINLERYYYRPYHTENDVIDLENVKQDGTFIGVYTVTSYDRDKKHVRTQETHVFGYTDLFLNDKQEVNLDKPVEFKYKYDETYSLDSVYQLLEGFDFKKVTK